MLAALAPLPLAYLALVSARYRPGHALRGEGSVSCEPRQRDRHRKTLAGHCPQKAKPTLLPIAVPSTEHSAQAYYGSLAYPILIESLQFRFGAAYFHLCLFLCSLFSLLCSSVFCLLILQFSCLVAVSFWCCLCCL